MDLIIISDSEEEIEIEGTPPNSPPTDSSSEPEEIESDNESEETESTDESEDIISEVELMSEDEPEEQINPITLPASPPRMAYHYTGPRTINVPKKRVAIHRRRRSPIITLPGDPYRGPPTIREVGESSNAPERNPVTPEPPEEAHTLWQDERIKQYNERMNRMEETIAELPTMGAIEEMDQTINTMAFQMSGIHDQTVNLREKVEESTNQLQDIEGQMARLSGLGRQFDITQENVTELNYQVSMNRTDAYDRDQRLYMMGVQMEEMDTTLKQLTAAVKRITDSRN